MCITWSGSARRAPDASTVRTRGGGRTWRSRVPRLRARKGRLRRMGKGKRARCFSSIGGRGSGICMMIGGMVEIGDMVVVEAGGAAAGIRDTVDVAVTERGLDGRGDGGMFGLETMLLRLRLRSRGQSARAWEPLEDSRRNVAALFECWPITYSMIPNFMIQIDSTV